MKHRSPGRWVVVILTLQWYVDRNYRKIDGPESGFLRAHCFLWQRVSGDAALGWISGSREGRRAPATTCHAG